MRSTCETSSTDLYGMITDGVLQLDGNLQAVNWGKKANLESCMTNNDDVDTGAPDAGIWKYR